MNSTELKRSLEYVFVSKQTGNKVLDTNRMLIEARVAERTNPRQICSKCYEVAKYLVIPGGIYRKLPIQFVCYNHAADVIRSYTPVIGPTADRLWCYVERLNRVTLSNIRISIEL